MPAAFSVSPAVDLIDVPRRIVLAGLPAGAEVTVVAETLRGGHPWRAQAVFAADAAGIVDLDRDAPLRGDYDGVAPMGLVWAQNGEGELFHADMAQPQVAAIVQPDRAEGVDEQHRDALALAFRPWRPSCGERLAAAVAERGVGQLLETARRAARPRRHGDRPGARMRMLLMTVGGAATAASSSSALSRSWQ